MFEEQISDTEVSVHSTNLSLKTTKLVSFLTSGNIPKFLNNLDGSEVGDYLSFADCYNLTALKNLCENELLSKLEPNESLKQLQIARAYGLSHLEDKCYKYLAEHFDTLSKSEEFQYLGENDLFEMVKNPAIAQNPHITEAVHYWYRYEPDPRTRSYNKINQFIRTNRQVFTTNIHQPKRKRENQYIALFTIDKSNHKAKPFVIIMEPERFTWIKIRLDKIGKCGPEFALCLQQNNIRDEPYVYFTGGKDISRKHVFRGDAILGKWKKYPNLKEGRSRHCCAEVNDKIYVLGGYQDFQCRNISSIEEYIHAKGWKIVGNLTFGVRSAGCAVHANQIYVFGGIVENKTPVAYIQRFNTDTHETKVLGCPIPIECSYCRVIMLDNYIFVVSANGHMIRFDPKTEKCETLASHPLKLLHFALFTDGISIFTAGGFQDHKTYTKNIYRYDRSGNYWEKLTYCLPEPMPIYGSCTIKMKDNWNIVPFI